MSTEFLQTLWFLLIAILWIGFFFLEGFDFGVGMLLPFFSKKDEERRAVINTIGPHWDGNEVWLIVAGGATFAAFPHWYATLFSGFYLALFLMLLGLIVRGVSIEFRSKVAHPRWRSVWDWGMGVGSLLTSFLLGVAFANLARGVPIDARMMYTGDLLTLLNPYGLLGGLVVVATFLFHGANFLSLKLADDLHRRAQDLSGRIWPVTVVLVAAWIIATYLATDLYPRLGVGSVIVGLVTILALVLAGILSRQRRDGWAFVVAGLVIILIPAIVFLIMFPRVMISSTDPAYSLTIYNASSSPYTLRIMSIVALIFVPIVLAYQIWSYRIFRQRIKAEPKSLTY
ncbi:MAG: cytochrome d ubiquinol oxidase subunit II [Anaerolineae bacterium]